MKILFLVFTAFTLVFSCGNGDNEVNKTNGLGNTWQLNSLNGQSYDSFDGKRPSVTIDIEKMSVYGNSGCNNYNGKIEQLTKSEVSFGPMASTRMACPGSHAESEFLPMFGSVKTYKNKGEELIFFDEKGNQIASFERVGSGTLSK